MMLFDPDGVVDSLVSLVLQRYDPDGVTKQIEKQNDSDSIPITCASASPHTHSDFRLHRGQTFVAN
jgi:hypothetical protein